MVDSFYLGHTLYLICIIISNICFNLGRQQGEDIKYMTLYSSPIVHFYHTVYAEMLTGDLFGDFD